MVYESYGDVLVTNCMMENSTFLVDRSSKHTDNALYYQHHHSGRLYYKACIEHFFDFCSLVENIILHDHLFTLDFPIYGKSAENYRSSEFLQSLRKEKIFKDREVSLDPKTVNEIEDYISHLSESSERDFFLDGIYPGGYLPHSNYSEEGADSYISRTYIYQKISNDKKIIFCPDFPRIPILNSINFNPPYTLRKQAYDFFSGKLTAEAESFLKYTEPIGLTIPPFTAVLLDRCNSVNDICSELLLMRDEYSDLRKELEKLEKKRVHCKNIDEFNIFKENTKKMFDSASKKFEKNELISMESLIQLAGSYQNLNTFSVEFLTKSLGFLQEYWHRKPLSQFFDLTYKYRNIENYHTLAKRIFNLSFDQHEVKSFRLNQNILNAKYSRYYTDLSP